MSEKNSPERDTVGKDEGAKLAKELIDTKNNPKVAESQAWAMYPRIDKADRFEVRSAEKAKLAEETPKDQDNLNLLAYKNARREEQWYADVAQANDNLAEATAEKHSSLVEQGKTDQANEMAQEGIRYAEEKASKTESA